MSQPIPIENIISLASDVRSSLGHLLYAYRKLIPLLEKEHAAIENRDLKVMEQVGQKKEIVGIEVDKNFVFLKTLCTKLDNYYQVQTRKNWSQQLGMIQIVEVLREIEASYIEKSSANKVLLHLIHEIKNRSVEFRMDFDRLQPDIERNRTVLRTMLESHRRSYTFWAGVVDEESSNYNQSGVKKSQQKSSLFQVRA